MDGPGGWRRPSRSVMTKMMKESVKTGHPTGLPDKLLRLFAPNEPMRYVKENCKEKKPPAVPWQGIGQYVKEFAVPGDPEYEPKGAGADFPEPRLYNNKEYDLQVRLDEETKREKEKRLREWKQEKAKEELQEKVAKYDPNNDAVIEGDPYKTLFVSRLSYEVTERKLRHEFEEYGPIKRIRLVHDMDKDKPRGYAFIEYEHKKDMKEAYKLSDGRKIEGRRILVDVERGRTVENWRPMRLGGGLGGDSRLPKEPRKKIIAEAIARGVAPPTDDRAGRRDDPRGPPRDYDSRGPPDRGGYGGPPRGPPMDRGGGYGGPPRGPPRDYGGGGGDRDHRGPPRDYDRDRGDRGGGGDRYGRGGGGGDRDRGGDRERDGRDKRSRDGSPSSRDYKRSRYDEERDRGRSRHDRDY